MIPRPRAWAPASYFHCNNGGGLTSAADRRVSPRFQYSVQSLSGYRFCLIVPYAAVRFDKRQKIIFHTSTILRSARFSRMQTTKKPHGYHKIAVWQKDDRIWKSPLKFYAQYYSILSGDCQALIIMEYWLSDKRYLCVRIIPQIGPLSRTEQKSL